MLSTDASMALEGVPHVTICYCCTAEYRLAVRAGQHNAPTCPMPYATHIVRAWHLVAGRIRVVAAHALPLISRRCLRVSCAWLGCMAAG